MKTRITDKVVKLLRPASTPYEVRDDELQGFLLRVQPSGSMTFYADYRNAVGARNRVKLGSYPTLTVPMAREQARRRLAEVTLGDDPAKEKREARQTIESLTLREFIEGPYKDWALSNLKSHDRTLARLIYGFKSLLDKRLDSLSAFDFERNRQARMKEKPKSKGKHGNTSPATCNRDQAHMRAALARAVLWGHMASNPLDGVTKSREDRNAKIRALTATEEKSLLETFATRRAARIAERLERIAAREPAGPTVPKYLSYLEPLIVVSLDTGIRRGEALELLWKDIDLEARSLTVRGGNAKSGQTRTVPLSTRATDTLTEWSKESGDTGRVFHGATVDSLKGQWSRLLRDAKVTGLRWHDLRHTFGTRCALAGVSVDVLRGLMGHSSITTTAKYLHHAAEDARSAIAALEVHNGGNVVPFPNTGEGS